MTKSKTATKTMGTTITTANPVILPDFPVVTDALATGRVMDAVLALTETVELDAALEMIKRDRSKPEVGDFLVCSWGYDQTNIDFYQVVAVTAASVKIRQVRNRRVEAREYTDIVEPIANAFYNETETSNPNKLKPMTKRVNVDEKGRGYSVRIESYATAALWDGEPRSETAAGYGH